MDEKEWTGEQGRAQHMLLRLNLHFKVQRTNAGRRKLRLFACGCVRAWWDDLTRDVFRDAVATAERYADGLATRQELVGTHEAVSSHYFGVGGPTRHTPLTQRASYMAAGTCYPEVNVAADMMVAYPMPHADGTPERLMAERLLCDLLRCVFGNPFRKPVFPKKWRTETVTSLAAGIYEERAFDRLPILADALEEAGCDDPAMLAHLRGDGPHCRGCWVVDLALGK